MCYSCIEMMNSADDFLSVACVIGELVEWE